jgi:hypothetical protein
VRPTAGVALAVLLGGCAATPTMGTIAPSPDYPEASFRAFVGAPISVEQDGYVCTTSTVDTAGNEDCLYADSVYQGRYRVVETLVGPLPAGEVKVRMAGHGGIPDDVHQPFVLLLVAERPDGLRMLRYQAHAVQRTVDGRWAACGDPLAGEDGSRASELRFPPGTEFGPSGRANDPYFIERRIRGAEPGDYEVRDGKLLCRRGIYIDEIVRRWGRVR